MNKNIIHGLFGVFVGLALLVGPAQAKNDYPPPYRDKNGVVIYPDPNFPNKRDPTPAQEYRNDLPPVNIINSPPNRRLTLEEKRIAAIHAPENPPGLSGEINLELVGGRWRGPYYGRGWRGGYYGRGWRGRAYPGPGYYPPGRYDVWRGGPWPGGDYDYVPPPRYEPNWGGRYLVPGGGYSYYSESVPYPRYVYPAPGYGPPPVYFEGRRRPHGGVAGNIGGFGFNLNF